MKKFGIRCCYSDYNGRKLSENELRNNNGFIGNEYLITNKDQILPLYCITLKRIEYLVIWRDYNFNYNNPNNYSEEIFNEMKRFHNIIKKKIVREFDSKIYYINTTKDALDLINKKKYNKIIIITNGSNDAKNFIINARDIIGGNVIVAVSVYNIKRHISWIKEMKNTILLNGIEYHEKFINSIMKNSINDLKDLRNEIIKNYSKDIKGFNLKEFDQNILNFPNFKNEGNFGELNMGRNNNSCQII